LPKRNSLTVIDSEARRDAAPPQSRPMSAGPAAAAQGPRDADLGTLILATADPAKPNNGGFRGRHG
jgi:hypothetical protein